MATITEQIQADVKDALKGGDKHRAQVLRMLVSELQKAAKEGDGDELAVLRRERKRRLDAAEQFSGGGREDLAGAERGEAEVIAGYLPAELPDGELRAIVDGAIAEAGASSPKDMGAVMKLVMARTGGRADGKRVSALVRDALAGG